MSCPPHSLLKPALVVLIIAATAAEGNEPISTASSPSSPSAPVSSAPSATLDAIESLESRSDAKCHSSASRFEDFLYGTPLGDAGRRENTELQKELVLRIWGAASEIAQQAGETSVGPERIREQVDALLHFEKDSEEDGVGQIVMQFPGQPPVVISATRAAQYGSIAYSLRAILAVQQELLLSTDYSPLPLSPASLELLRLSIDRVSLSALMLADQRAREQNAFEIGEADMRVAWHRLVPKPSGDSRAEVLLGAAASGARRASREQGLALLDELIAGKLAAYEAYNGLNGRQMDVLFKHNIRRFYARAPLPKLRGGENPLTAAQVDAAYKAILRELELGLDDFSLAVLNRADAHAARSGHRLIDADDANWAVQQSLPHEIDDFEDVHLFPRLVAAERITLEAHDCDSFRDSGTHWPSLRRSLHRMAEDARLPDPYAAEIVAEAISQYGVLLLRLSGTIAKHDRLSVRLHADDLARGREQIESRARRHHAAPPKPEAVNRIASSSGQTDREVLSQSQENLHFFTDVTQQSGVEFVHRSSNWLSEFRRRIPKSPPTYSGGGVAAEDVNGDSHIDLLFVGGIGNALLINDGKGHFRDVTREAGIVLRRPDGSHGEARNPIVADFDNDGLQDILISYVDDDHRLYRNMGGGRFDDVSAASGLGGKGLVAGPLVVFDYDGDGLLDVYVGHMGNYLRRIGPSMRRHNDNALPNQLFRNRGGMRFEDVTAGSGVADLGWTQALSHADLDRDGRQDIIVANDFGRNALLRNLGDGKFEDIAPKLGMTKAYHSMNVGIADLNLDGFPDIYVSNIATLVKDNKYVFPDSDTPLDFDLRAMAGMLVAESDILYLSRTSSSAAKPSGQPQQLVAYEPSADVERGESSTGWAWDAEFFDFDNDGDEDLYLVNGTNDYNAAYASVLEHPVAEGRVDEYLLGYSRDANVLFMNQAGKLKNVSSRSGANFAGNSRSTAYLDFDNDGDLDIAINGFHSPARVLRNNTESRGLHWLKLRLVGDPEKGSNRDAIGARILITGSDSLRIDREVRCGSGFLSMNPKQQHFGLGNRDAVDVVITWPSGEEQRLGDLQANRAYIVRQGVRQRAGPNDPVNR